MSETTSIIIGSVLGIIGGVLLMPYLSQRRMKKRLKKCLQTIKRQKLRYWIDGKEIKFEEQVEKELEKYEKEKALTKESKKKKRIWKRPVKNAKK